MASMALRVFPDVRGIWEELNTLKCAGTWELVDPPPSANIVGSKWVFWAKKDAAGNVVWHKAHLIGQGFSHVPGVDYFSTFAPVATLVYSHCSRHSCLPQLRTPPDWHQGGISKWWTQQWWSNLHAPALQFRVWSSPEQSLPASQDSLWAETEWPMMVSMFGQNSCQQSAIHIVRCWLGCVLSAEDHWQSYHCGCALRQHTIAAKSWRRLRTLNVPSKSMLRSPISASCTGC